MLAASERSGVVVLGESVADSAPDSEERDSSMAARLLESASSTRTPATGDVVLVRTLNGLHALDKTSGEVLWRTDDLATATSAPASEPEYVVEAGSGAIFARSSGRLRRLPMTLPQLVDLSPYQAPGTEGHLMVGRRSTSLVGLDLATGRLEGVFGADGGWCSWSPTSMTDALALRSEDRSCDDDVDRRPTDLLFLNRAGQPRARRV